MAQADQSIQNATFPTVRADINDNLAALFSQSSGASAPAVTVAYQPWIDTSSSPAVWKVRNAANNGWITIGTIDATTFAAGGVTQIANGGTGQTTASGAINALLPSQSGNAEKYLKTNGSVVSWALAAAGASVQVFTSSATYTPSAGKTTFLVIATGGGGGGGGGSNFGGSPSTGNSGGGAGTAIRLYTSTELGATASIAVGAGGSGGSSGTNVPGAAGGSTTLTPSNGLSPVLTASGGGGGGGAPNGGGGGGGGSTNSLFAINGTNGRVFVPGISFFGAGVGSAGSGGSGSSPGSAGAAGVLMVIEW